MKTIHRRSFTFERIAERRRWEATRISFLFMSLSVAIVWLLYAAAQ